MNRTLNSPTAQLVGGLLIGTGGLVIGFVLLGCPSAGGAASRYK